MGGPEQAEIDEFCGEVDDGPDPEESTAFEDTLSALDRSDHEFLAVYTRPVLTATDCAETHGYSGWVEDRRVVNYLRSQDDVEVGRDETYRIVHRFFEELEDIVPIRSKTGEHVYGVREFREDDRETFMIAAEDTYNERMRGVPNRDVSNIRNEYLTDGYSGRLEL